MSEPPWVSVKRAEFDGESYDGAACSVCGAYGEESPFPAPAVVRVRGRELLRLCRECGLCLGRELTDFRPWGEQ